MAHPDAPAEVPSDEPPRQEPLSTDVDKERGFDVFWAAYPARNGRKVGKAKAMTKWRSFALETKRQVYAATVHYAAAVAAGTTIAKDPERFLAGRYWEDWVEAGGPHQKPATSPLDGQAAAARAIEDRSRRVRSGEACALCGDVGVVLGDDDVARPCACRKAS